MKTRIICVGMVMAALLLGMRQHEKIVELERKVEAVASPRVAREPGRRDGGPETVRLGKPRVRPMAPGAPEVFRTVLGLLNPDTHRSVSGGANSAMDHPEIFAAIMKLDLAGQNELIALIGNSNDPKFSDDLYKCLLVNLCLCAMADRHPEVALEILNHANERIGRYFSKRMGPQPMIHYVMHRLSDLDPTAGMSALVASAAKDADSWSGNDVAELIASVLERDPQLALETIGKLPESQQVESWRVAVAKAGTQEDCERVFRQLFVKPMSNRGKMIGILGALFGNVRKHAPSWDGFAAWLGGMTLSDEMKKSVAPALERVVAHGEEEKIAAWLLDSLPPSKERDYLVWRTTIGFWAASGPAEAAALLREQGIDPEEMMELNRKGYLRETF